MTDIESIEATLQPPPQFAFPDRQIYQANEAPCRFEAEIYHCETKGVIPSQCNGTYYRTMPDQEWSPQYPDDVYFNGDGAVTAFRFKDGNVDFKHKFVRTRKFINERAAGRHLWGKFWNMYVADPAMRDEITANANTHVIYYNHMLLALSENSLPFAMDPDTLDTIGPYDFQGQFKPKVYTAHPKVDPATGEILSISYMVKGTHTPTMAFYTFDARGNKIAECWFDAPYAGMTHDIGVSENYIIVVLTPNTIASAEHQKAGGQFFMWDDSLPLAFGVLPRHNPKPEDVKWFQYKNAYGVHTGSAWDEADGCVYLDIPVAESNRMFYFNPPRKQGAAANVPQSSYMRFKFDYSSTLSTSATKDVMAPVSPVNAVEINGEFPIFDYRYFGRKASKVFLVVAPPRGDKKVQGATMATKNTTVTLIDQKTGEMKHWSAGDTCAITEVAFCPRSEDAPEGDGFLVAVVNRHKKLLTSVVILDSTKIEAGPIGIINLPFRLRTGTHGSWVPERWLPRGRQLCDMSGVSEELVRKWRGVEAKMAWERFEEQLRSDVGLVNGGIDGQNGVGGGHTIVANGIAHA